MEMQQKRKLDEFLGPRVGSLELGISASSTGDIAQSLSRKAKEIPLMVETSSCSTLSFGLLGLLGGRLHLGPQVEELFQI